MVVMELVREPLSAKKATVKEAEAATKRAAKDAKKADKKAEEAKAAEVEATEATEAAAVEFEGGAAPLEDGSAPEGYTVKGNADSMKYHEPDGQWYDQTIAEVWFKSAEDAEAAGFTKAGA
jgi:large subunit ribosomal protein L17